MPSFFKIPSWSKVLKLSTLSMHATMAFAAKAAVPRFDVVATGGAYVDYIATVPVSLLKAEGLPLDGGRSLTTEQMRRLRTKLDQPVVRAGGMSANTVANVAALGGRAGFIGKVAADEAGDVFAADFAARDVSWCCDSRADGNVPTGQTYVLVHGEQRTVAYTVGCSELLTDADFERFDFATTQSFLVEGAQLVSPTLGPVVRRAVRNARPHTRIVFNLQSFEEVADAKLVSIVSFVARTADVIIGNEREYAAFARLSKTSPGQTVVVTRGDRGVLLTAPNRVRVDLPAVTPLVFQSAVGAGDAFTAGYLLGLALGIPPRQSVARGIKAATAVLGEVGGRLPIAPR